MVTPYAVTMRIATTQVVTAEAFRSQQVATSRLCPGRRRETPIVRKKISPWQSCFERRLYLLEAIDALGLSDLDEGCRGDRPELGVRFLDNREERLDRLARRA